LHSNRVTCLQDLPKSHKGQQTQKGAHLPSAHSMAVSSCHPSSIRRTYEGETTLGIVCHMWCPEQNHN
jgi:hypothetical protein